MNQDVVNFEHRSGNSSVDLLDPHALFSNQDPLLPDTQSGWSNDSGDVSVGRYEYLNRMIQSHEIRYLVNVTADVPIEYAMWMFGYIMPFLLVLTILSNTLVVIVLSRKHMISSTNIVLLGMAISDMLTLLCPAPWYLYMYTLGNHEKVLSPPTACYAFYWMNEVLPAFFHTASIWLTVLLAVQRYIYVCHPTSARTWCTGIFYFRFLISFFMVFHVK